MTISGVRPGSWCTSTVSPGIGRLRHHPSIRSTARCMWPFASHSGSNDGDTLGIAMYSWRTGTMSSQTRLT